MDPPSITHALSKAPLTEAPPSYADALSSTTPTTDPDTLSDYDDESDDPVLTIDASTRVTGTANLVAPQNPLDAARLAGIIAAVLHQRVDGRRVHVKLDLSVRVMGTRNVVARMGGGIKAAAARREQMQSESQAAAGDQAGKRRVEEGEESEAKRARRG